MRVSISGNTPSYLPGSFLQYGVHPDLNYPEYPDKPTGVGALPGYHPGISLNTGIGFPGQFYRMAMHVAIH